MKKDDIGIVQNITHSRKMENLSVNSFAFSFPTPNGCLPLLSFPFENDFLYFLEMDKMGKESF